MSQLPRYTGGKPVIKSTSTVTSRTPAGGVRTTTTTNIRQLEPCAAAGPSIGQGSCPPTCTSQTGSSMRRRQHTSRAGPPQQPRPQMPTMPGQYSVPAQYGPMSLQGKGTVYSSPQDLRGRMESRIPKNVKYERIGADAESRPRTAMGGALADTFSGNFNVYGGQVMDQEATMRSRDLNERVPRKMYS